MWDSLPGHAVEILPLVFLYFADVGLWDSRFEFFGLTECWWL